MGPPIPLYEPLESGRNDNIYISKSYDATSHFETTTGTISRLRSLSLNADFLADDVRDIYRRAEQEELIVEGLREGQQLVEQE